MMSPTALMITPSRQEQLLAELRVALKATRRPDLSAWSRRSGRHVGRASVRRLRNLKRLAGVGLEAVKAETERFRASESLGSYASERGGSVWAFARDAWSSVSQFARENPETAAIRLALFCFGFYAGSGGLDGDGGIPDLDWEFGHRSLLTHSVAPGIVAEVAIVALVDLVRTVHSKLPEQHDPLWDTIKARSVELNMLAVGVSAGLSYHLGIDATIDGGGVYQDLPFSIPQEGHQAVAGGMAAAEGVDAAQRRRVANRPERTEPPVKLLHGRRVNTLGDLRETFHLYAVCSDCRRVVALDICELVKKYGPMMAVRDIKARLTCGQCGKRTRDIRFVYSGGAR